jgi:hypothetical protein
LQVVKNVCSLEVFLLRQVGLGHLAYIAAHPMPTIDALRELRSIMQAQALLIDRLQLNADIQMTRIAQLQAELDALPHARRRRHALLRNSLSQPPPAKHNGNGNGR